MRWLFLTVLVLVAGALGAFAIYAWGIRESSESDERHRAAVFASELESACQGACHIRDLTQLTKGVWRLRLNNATRTRLYACLAIHLDEFRPPIGGSRRFIDFEGIASIAC
jgi:hypothetical protein